MSVVLRLLLLPLICAALGERTPQASGGPSLTLRVTVALRTPTVTAPCRSVLASGSMAHVTGADIRVSVYGARTPAFTGLTQSVSADGKHVYLTVWGQSAAVPPGLQMLTVTVSCGKDTVSRDLLAKSSALYLQMTVFGARCLRTAANATVVAADGSVASVAWGHLPHAHHEHACMQPYTRPPRDEL